MNRAAPRRWPLLLPSLPALLCVALLVPAGSVSALPDDSEQPIEILADQALRDDQRGYTLYTGDVELSQGSLLIRAERLTVFHAEGDGQRIVAEGTPARMQQQPDVDKAVIYASADTITYFRATERVRLDRNARVEQDGAVVRGNLILYLIPEQRVRADAGADDSEGRVQVVIPARAANGERGDAGPSAGGAAPAKPPSSAEPGGPAGNARADESGPAAARDGDATGST